MEPRNKKLLAGYAFAITGFVMLTLNALFYLAEKEFSDFPFSIALLIFIVGAVLINKNKNN